MLGSLDNKFAVNARIDAKRSEELWWDSVHPKSYRLEIDEEWVAEYLKLMGIKGELV